MGAWGIDAAEPHVSPDGLILEIMLTPDGRADPYPRYRALRERAPVHRSELMAIPALFLTRYEDCRAVLRDPAFGKPPTDAAPDPDRPESALFPARRDRRPDPIASRSMLNLNPPDHTRVRGLVSRGFTPRRVESLRPAVEAMAGELIDVMAEQGDVEVIDALGFRLPVRVIGELVGVPASDRDQFRTKVRTVAAALEPGTTDEQLDEALVVTHELQDYFRELIAERRARPADDLTSALIAARDVEDRLTEEELIATLILIFAAGFETTTNLIGNGLLTLLRHPAELARLRADPSLLPAAVEEILRFESPVQLDARMALAPTEVAGHQVAPGEFAVTFLGAANRDPDVYDEPETFRVAERDTPVLSFASGIHYCLGASLARLEGQVVFGRLLERFGTLELLDDQPAWRNTFVLRGLEHLHVRVSP